MTSAHRPHPLEVWLCNENVPQQPNTSATLANSTASCYVLAPAMAHAQQPAERHEPKLDATYDSYDFPIIAPAPQNGHPGFTTEMQEAQVNQLRMMLEQDGFKERLDTLTLV